MDEYIIVGDEGQDGEKNYWSNKDGWSDYKESATLFTEDDARALMLPVGKNVRWEKYVQTTKND